MPCLRQRYTLFGPWAPSGAWPSHPQSSRPRSKHYYPLPWVISRTSGRWVTLPLAPDALLIMIIYVETNCLIIIQIIEEIRHSVTALKDLPPEIRLPARLVYYRGIRYAFAASTAFAAIAFIASLFANPRKLRSTHK